ncbi:hypothetical protein FF011L_37810 [Roseimaritima multifibrata]|uniref:Uncharacterized protein n=1 Tax=Roseimaritima multifibrata TaxID=1930274 RepID=A0A517MJN7_9BACT|nr:hypothetical protein [Roseimaritima multifibrata]QDS94997.1 hypothetical protein FF011L_37810 [Roseimaritima multifibrata]
MNKIAKIVSLITLGLVIVPCLQFFVGTASLETVKTTALIGTIGWFIATPIWMSRPLPSDAERVEI